MKLVYLDSVIPIYALDHTGTFQARALARLAASVASGDRYAVSDLTRLDCRVLPIRLADAVRWAEFDAFFARSDVTIVPLTPAVFDRATEIRAFHSFRAQDAIHLAAAVQVGCDLFLTNDTLLSRFPGIAVEVLP